MAKLGSRVQPVRSNGPEVALSASKLQDYRHHKEPNEADTEPASLGVHNQPARGDRTQYSISRLTQMARFCTFELGPDLETAQSQLAEPAASSFVTRHLKRASAASGRSRSQLSLVSLSSSPGQKCAPKVSAENDKFLRRFATNNAGNMQQANRLAASSRSLDGTSKLSFGLVFNSLKDFVVDPAREFHYRWMSIISLAICYNIIFIIGRSVFWKLHNQYALVWYSLDYLCDLVYLIDILIHSRTGYLEQGILVRDINKLTRHYVESFAFKLDLISILPTDLAYAFMAKRCLSNRVPCAIIVRLNRLFRFHRLAQFFDRTESATNFPFIFRISKLIFYILVIIHWNASLYFAVSYAIGFGTDHWVYRPISADPTGLVESWLTNQHQPSRPVTFGTHSTSLIEPPRLTAYNGSSSTSSNSNNSDNSSLPQKQVKLSDPWQQPVSFQADDLRMENDTLLHQYIYCFYWSTLTLTTIGEVPMPERDEEYAFVVLDFLIGLLVFATIVGNIGSMISNMNAARADFQHKMDSVKQWMKFRRVNKELEDRIIKWFDYLWENRQTLDEDAVTAILPDRLKAETAIHVHLETLKRVQLFQDCEPGLLVQLVLKLKLQVFSPGDYICRVGDVGKEMYIVKRGELSVLAEDCQTIYGKLSDGSVFGELSILNISGVKTGNRRTANVRSVGYSDLFALSKQDLWNVLEDYPDAKTLLVNRGKQILRKDGLLASEQDTCERTSVSNLELDSVVDLSGKNFQQSSAASTYGLAGDANSDIGIVSCQTGGQMRSTSSSSGGSMTRHEASPDNIRPQLPTATSGVQSRIDSKKQNSNSKDRQQAKLIESTRSMTAQSRKQKRFQLMRKSLSFAQDASAATGGDKFAKRAEPFSSLSAVNLSVSDDCLLPVGPNRKLLGTISELDCIQKSVAENMCEVSDKLTELCSSSRENQTYLQSRLARLERLLANLIPGDIGPASGSMCQSISSNSIVADKPDTPCGQTQYVSSEASSNSPQAQTIINLDMHSSYSNFGPSAGGQERPSISRQQEMSVDVASVDVATDEASIASNSNSRQLTRSRAICLSDKDIESADKQQQPQ